jgi:autotransporter translocation and assembly factor TamB
LPNLTISGGIDFTEFFRPRYDITLKGEELYLRTLLAEQEGVVTGSFTMTGRDSILYEGEVEVEDFIIRNEFAGREEVIQNNKPSKFYSAVNLHLIIPGSLQFKNAQLDGDLDGEMWIIRNGDEPYRFSGTLDILDGSFYYYGWEFEVVSGSISFDPIEFNPTLDIEAQVDLAAYGMADTTSSSSGESELVTVYLTGYLDNPSLEFESANYSQSDILMFLSRAQNIGSETTGQDQLSASAANVVGSWFERQIERNIGRMAGLDDFELRTNGNLLSSNPTTDQWSVVLGRKLASNLLR